jgi:hypothetical protein
MRKRATYCMTDSPTSSVKRAAKADRDIAASDASDATGPGARGLPVDERQCPADLVVRKRSEPPGLRFRVFLDPRADRLDDQDVGEPRHHRFAAGPELLRLRGHEVEVLSIHSIRGELEAST